MIVLNTIDALPWATAEHMNLIVFCVSVRTELAVKFRLAVCCNFPLYPTMEMNGHCTDSLFGGYHSDSIGFFGMVSQRWNLSLSDRTTRLV